MKIVYIAGPMTGYEKYNFPAFDERARIIRESGDEAINPADNFHRRTDLEWYMYIAKAIQQVLEDATAIYFMKGWEGSRGARIEYLVANARGLQMEFEETPPVNALAILNKIVQEAYTIVHGDRNADYGSPVHDFRRQMDMATVMGIPMTVLDVPLFMLCVKLSREVNKPKRDNLVDLAGYVLCHQWVKKDLTGSEA